MKRVLFAVVLGGLACRHAPPSEPVLRAKLDDMACFGSAYALHASQAELEGEAESPEREAARFKDYVHQLADVHGLSRWGDCLRERRPKGWSEELKRVDGWLLRARENAARLEAQLPAAKRLTGVVESFEAGASSLTYRYALSYADGREDALTETHPLAENLPSAPPIRGRIRMPCLGGALYALRALRPEPDGRSAAQRAEEALEDYAHAFENVQGQKKYLACLEENKEDGWEAKAARVREQLVPLEKELAARASLAERGRTLIDVKTGYPSADPALLIVRTQLFFSDGTTRLLEKRYPKKP